MYAPSVFAVCTYELNGSCIHEKGSDKGHIGDKNGFLLLTPISTSRGLEDVDTG